MPDGGFSQAHTLTKHKSHLSGSSSCHAIMRTKDSLKQETIISSAIEAMCKLHFLITSGGRKEYMMPFGNQKMCKLQPSLCKAVTVRLRQ